MTTFLFLVIVAIGIWAYFSEDPYAVLGKVFFALALIGFAAILIAIGA